MAGVRSPRRAAVEERSRSTIPRLSAPPFDNKTFPVPIEDLRTPDPPHRPRPRLFWERVSFDDDEGRREVPWTGRVDPTPRTASDCVEPSGRGRGRYPSTWGGSRGRVEVEGPSTACRRLLCRPRVRGRRRRSPSRPQTSTSTVLSLFSRERIRVPK